MRKDEKFMKNKEGKVPTSPEECMQFIKEEPQDIFYLADLVANSAENNVYEDDFIECLYNVIKCGGTAKKQFQD
jgi:hypothetical protein